MARPDSLKRTRDRLRRKYATDPEFRRRRIEQAKCREWDRTVTPETVSEMLDRQGGKCNTCAADLSVTGFHRDHVVPLSKGGPSTLANLQLLCPPCNLSKGAKLLPQHGES